MIANLEDSTEGIRSSQLSEGEGARLLHRQAVERRVSPGGIGRGVAAGQGCARRDRESDRSTVRRQVAELVLDQDDDGIAQIVPAVVGLAVGSGCVAKLSVFVAGTMLNELEVADAMPEGVADSV